VEEHGEVTSANLAQAFGWTVPGAASTLLRLHRQGHLWQRRRSGAAMRFAYFYSLFSKTVFEGR
jgi:hypothetical protein